MPALVWDKIGDRIFETGLDRGVLYLSDGLAVPWNGLLSVVEQPSKEFLPIYYDGVKISDVVILGDFSASVRAITYPDEFLELEGLGSLKSGVFVGDQSPKSFSLSYRTLIGNDLEGETAGYKIHIIYNLTAVPSEKAYVSMAEEATINEFEWTITAIPEEVSKFHPSAHIIIDSRNTNPLLLESLEMFLYGKDSSSPSLPPMSELITFINEYALITIIDNKNGTWTAISAQDSLIVIEPDGRFTITEANSSYIAAETYLISNTPLA